MKAKENYMLLSGMKPELYQINQSVISELSHEPGLQVAVLYGTAAAGKLRPDSDIDLAVLYDRPLSVENRLTLLEQLDKRLSMPVDLVDLSQVSGVILREILCRGKVLIKKNPQIFVQLIQRLVYNQEDVMPYYRAALRERAERFANV